MDYQETSSSSGASGVSGGGRGRGGRGGRGRGGRGRGGRGGRGSESGRELAGPSPQQIDRMAAGAKQKDDRSRKKWNSEQDVSGNRMGIGWDWEQGFKNKGYDDDNRSERGGKRGGRGGNGLGRGGGKGCNGEDIRGGYRGGRGRNENGVQGQNHNQYRRQFENYGGGYDNSNTSLNEKYTPPYIRDGRGGSNAGPLNSTRFDNATLVSSFSNLSAESRNRHAPMMEFLASKFTKPNITPCVTQPIIPTPSQVVPVAGTTAIEPSDEATISKVAVVPPSSLTSDAIIPTMPISIASGTTNIPSGTSPNTFIPRNISAKSQNLFTIEQVQEAISKAQSGICGDHATAGSSQMLKSVELIVNGLNCLTIGGTPPENVHQVSEKSVAIHSPPSASAPPEPVEVPCVPLSRDRRLTSQMPESKTNSTYLPFLPSSVNTSIFKTSKSCDATTPSPSKITIPTSYVPKGVPNTKFLHAGDAKATNDPVKSGVFSSPGPDLTPGPSSLSSQVPVGGETKSLSFSEKLKEYKAKKDSQVTPKVNAHAFSQILNKRKADPALLAETIKLPIYSRKEELIKQVKANQFLIVVGDTGSGKSTQIPQFLVAAGLHGKKQIGVTQPRRIAAKALADRVARECNVMLGSAVGYAVRFDKSVSKDTIIKYMTDGLMVEEFINRGDLNNYSVIMIDEAHERSTDTDLCLGILKRIGETRKDLKVIVSSATLEAEKFSEFLNCEIFDMTGEGHNVEVIHTGNDEEDEEYIPRAIDIVRYISIKNTPGDILVFLAGQDDIEEMLKSLLPKLIEISDVLEHEIRIIPCYGALPLAEQQKIFSPTPRNCRKVVLATNIAETSLTIDGIVFVVDCGVHKENHYDHSSGISSLRKLPITKFQAIQRQGRAGRTQPGICYRLYTEEEYQEMKTAPLPEILRSNLESVILKIFSMGYSDPSKFPFLDIPTEEHMLEATSRLQELGIVDDNVELTGLGGRVAELPMDPPLAKALLESEKLGCVGEMLKVVAMLSTQHHHLFFDSTENHGRADANRAKFHDSTNGDLLSLLKVYNSWVDNDRSETWCNTVGIHHRILVEAEDIRKQLQDILQRQNDFQGRKSLEKCVNLEESIRRAFTSGYCHQLAMRKKGRRDYQALTNPRSPQYVSVHRSSSLYSCQNPPPLVVYHQLIRVKKSLMRILVPIKPEWVREYAPEFANKLNKNGHSI